MFYSLLYVFKDKNLYLFSFLSILLGMVMDGEVVIGFCGSFEDIWSFFRRVLDFVFRDLIFLVDDIFFIYKFDCNRVIYLFIGILNVDVKSFSKFFFLLLEIMIWILFLGILVFWKFLFNKVKGIL